MIGRETPRVEFKIDVTARWFLNAEELAELFRAMAAAPAEIYFTSEEINRVVDWLARETALNAMSAVGGGGTVPNERKPELLSSAFNARLAKALTPPAAEPANEPVRKLLRQIFEQSAKAIAKVETP